MDLMARWGSCDFEQLKAFQNRLDRLSKTELDRFCRDMAKELAARMLQKAIKRTPVDTGTLRRGWTGGKNNMSAKGNVIGVRGKTGAAAGLTITEKDGNYEIVVSNSVLYASYVEYGHRRKPGIYLPKYGKCTTAGWTPGQFMMSVSARQLESQAPKLIEKKLQAHLRRCLNGK